MNENSSDCTHCGARIHRVDLVVDAHRCRMCSRMGVPEEMPEEFATTSHAIRMWPFQQVCRDLHRRATYAELEFNLDACDLSVQWVAQERVCHFTDEPLSYVELMRRARDGYDPMAENPAEPLVLRLDPMRGFVAHNIVWIVRKATKSVGMLKHRIEASRRCMSHGWTA